MNAIFVFAQAEYPVKLRFENASTQQVSILLDHQSVPEIIALAWNQARDQFSTNPPGGSIAEYDLNHDGTKEVFLYLSGSGMCGRGGCHLIIFHFNEKNNSLEYKTALSASDDILILDSKTHNHRNIAVRLMNGSDRIQAKKEEYALYRWNHQDLIQTDKRILFQLQDHCD